MNRGREKGNVKEKGRKGKEKRRKKGKTGTIEVKNDVSGKGKKKSFSKEGGEKYYLQITI